MADYYGHATSQESIIPFLESPAGSTMWNTNVGMTSAGAFEALSSTLGVPLRGVTEAQAIAALEAGQPVVINTPKHYFLAQGYQNGTFDTGNTGQSVFNQRYLSDSGIASYGGGAIRDWFVAADATFGRGGVITRPSLLVDAESLQAYAIMAENGPERIIVLWDDSGSASTRRASARRRRADQRTEVS